MSNRLHTEFLGKRIQSPLVLASGIMGISYSGMLKAIENGAGMVTTKSFTLEKRKGHEGPCVAEFSGGFINSMGLSNSGLKEGLYEVEDFKAHSEAPLILSVFGTTAEEFIMLTTIANSSKADFLELNLSCPNVADEFGTPLSASKEIVFEIIHAVKQHSKIPVIAKLSPNTFNVAEIAIAAEGAGADALNLINTLGPGMIIDINARKPVILNKFGGISGPAIKPIAIKLVYEISRKVKIPILGTGGLISGNDVIEMLMAGAGATGIGTAVYYRGIEVYNLINMEILQFMDEHEIENVTDIKPI